MNHFQRLALSSDRCELGKKKKGNSGKDPDRGNIRQKGKKIIVREKTRTPKVRKYALKKPEVNLRQTKCGICHG